jgi:hypothetical protein
VLVLVLVMGLGRWVRCVEGWVRSNVQWIGGYVERKVEMRWGIRPPSRFLHCLLYGRCEVVCDIGQSICTVALGILGSWVSGRCEIVMMCGYMYLCIYLQCVRVVSLLKTRLLIVGATPMMLCP